MIIRQLNARYAVDAGIAQMLKEQEMERLTAQVLDLLNQPAQLAIRN
jgi:UDP-N-acetylglucosamine:LPS N-acetylglucosamine transferase